MNRLVFLLVCPFVVSCAATRSPEGAAARAGTASSEAVASRSPLDIVDVEVEAARRPESDVVCRDVTRPGSRIVVGETCFPRGRRGVNVETREEIQREISGRGWQAGWKTEQQIEAERRLSMGGR